MLTEKQKYRNWLEIQIRDHGLVDARLCVDPMGEDLDMDTLRFNDLEDEVYRELNAMNAAIARGDVTPITDL